MGDKTGIQWTEATWNPVTGCTKVSPGCKHCYAETVFPRAYGRAEVQIPLTPDALPGDVCTVRKRKFTDVLTHADRLDQPLRWKRPRRIFVNSMSDLFHEDVPDAFIGEVFMMMALCQGHTFQVLTKRPERMRALVSDPDSVAVGAMAVKDVHRQWPLPNVWLGVSCEDQQRADERIPLLLQTPAAVRFVSAEPLLGPIEFNGVARHLLGPASQSRGMNDGLDWVIIGGESGASARPCDLRWIRDIRDQCKAAGVACFVKQLGANVGQFALGMEGTPWVGGPMHDRKGGDIDEWPADLRVREYPR